MLLRLPAIFHGFVCVVIKLESCLSLIVAYPFRGRYILSFCYLLLRWMASVGLNSCLICIAFCTFFSAVLEELHALLFKKLN